MRPQSLLLCVDYLVIDDKLTALSIKQHHLLFEDVPALTFS